MARQNNAEYWARRFKNMEEALLDQSFAYVQNLDEQFAIAQAEIERQMAAWYQRFAVNNEITFAEAKRLLNTKELAEFNWTVAEYIAYGQQNALDGRWMKQLENASARVHISRLEALKLQIQQQAEVLYSNQLDALDMAARRMYEGSYYHTAFEVQRGLGVGWTMHAINEATITKVLSRPWTTDNQTFRDRCWTNKQSLVNAVNTQLTQMIIRGEAPDRAISAIAKQFGVARNKAGRLVMTESAYFSSTAQRDCYAALDVERYEIIASFDHETCELCAAMDGKVFKQSEYQVGLTAPPFHPWCRCCSCPYFEDMAGIGERWTRNEDGTTKKVPRDMTFEDWKKSFVEPEPEVKTGTKVASIVPEPEPDLEPDPATREYAELDLEQFKKMKGSITAEERKIVYGRGHFSGYIASSEAKYINADIREGRTLSAKRQEIADTLQKVIDKNTLDHDIMVFRYVGDNAFRDITGVTMPQATLKMTSEEFFALMDALPSQIPAGHVYTEKAFLSTSGVLGKNVMDRRTTMLRIRCPAGTHGYVTTNNRESEIIFGQGTKLRILSATVENSGTADCKVILDCIIE